MPKAYREIELKSGKYKSFQLQQLITQCEEGWKVEVMCPTCKIKNKTIFVPTSIFPKDDQNTKSIIVKEGTICDKHGHIVYVDKNGVARGTEIYDFEIQSDF